jgi:hypothetical protein
MNLEIFAVAVEEQSPCQSCGKWAIGKYRVQSIAGVYCSMSCIETGLFGQGHCRWCGKDMERQYTSIESRLCSEGCRDNYFARVMGDRSAALGTGARFVQWLQSNAPKAYALLTGGTPARKLGRPTLNHHTMSAAERMKEYRARKVMRVTKVGTFEAPAMVVA